MGLPKSKNNKPPASPRFLVSPARKHHATTWNKRDHGEHEKIPWSMYDHDHNFFGSVSGAGGAADSEAFLRGKAAAGSIEAEGEGREEEGGVVTVAGPGTGTEGGGKQRDPFHVSVFFFFQTSFFFLTAFVFFSQLVFQLCFQTFCLQFHIVAPLLDPPE